METGDDVRENVKKYYGSRLDSSNDLQTSAASCSLSCSSVRSVADALSLVHPEVTKRFFGCGLPFPAKLDGCRVLDLGSGSGRDCYAFSKLVGPSGHVTGIDMTEELITMSRQYIEYHQKKFGYKEPNVTFVQGYMEKLGEAGIQSDSMDVVLSNCVICLCPDKRAVLQEAHRVLKVKGWLVLCSGRISSHWLTVLDSAPPSWSQQARLWSTTVSSKQKQLPKTPVMSEAAVTYKGTVADFPAQLDFDSSHCFKKDVPLEVNGEMAAILQSSRFSPDFKIQIMDKPASSSQSASQCCHLNPFLLADKVGSSVRQCSKTGK
ncbi:arsenite methyltransferase isoform 2-T2 [Aulostomus maculatus]